MGNHRKWGEIVESLVDYRTLIAECMSSVRSAILAVQWLLGGWDAFLVWRQLNLHKATEKRPDDVKEIISEVCVELLPYIRLSC